MSKNGEKVVKFDPAQLRAVEALARRLAVQEEAPVSANEVIRRATAAFVEAHGER